jgi:hypothetical protein
VITILDTIDRAFQAAPQLQFFSVAGHGSALHGWSFFVLLVEAAARVERTTGLPDLEILVTFGAFYRVKNYRSAR